MMLLMTLLVGDEGDDDSFRGWWCWLMVTVTRSKKTSAPWQEPSVYLQPGFGLVRKLPEPANRTFEKWSLFLYCLSTVSVWHTYANKKGTQNTDKHKHMNKVLITLLITIGQRPAHRILIQPKSKGMSLFTISRCCLHMVVFKRLIQHLIVETHYI